MNFTFYDNAPRIDVYFYSPEGGAPGLRFIQELKRAEKTGALLRP